MPFEDAIAHSRNVATGRVALMLGQTTEEASAVLYDMWQRLGIGKPTGIELAQRGGRHRPSARPKGSGFGSTSSTAPSASPSR